MTTHMIFALVGGRLDPDLELQLAARLPMTLRRIERTDECAPDYRIDAGDAVEVGFGRSRTTPGSAIAYDGVLPIVEPVEADKLCGLAGIIAEIEDISGARFSVDHVYYSEAEAEAAWWERTGHNPDTFFQTGNAGLA